MKKIAVIVSASVGVAVASRVFYQAYERLANARLDRKIEDTRRRITELTEEEYDELFARMQAMAREA
jgi:hypothetical protein